jgi:uncharacterized protein (TIGR03067 family)
MVLKLLACLAVGLLVAGDDAKKEDKDKEAKKIIGTWTAVSMERNGQKAPEEEFKGLSVIFAADGKVTVKTPGKEDTTGKYKLDTTKKVKEITLVEADTEKTLYGIYKIDGDNLTICADDTGADTRPTEFATKEGSTARLVVLKREKK